MSSSPSDGTDSSRQPSVAPIQAVADLAGVSIATVSRVINRTKPVNEKTRARVEAAVAQLGYHANPFARILTSGESRLLLVLVPNFENPFYAGVLQGIERVTRESGYKILVVSASKGWARDRSTLDTLKSGLVDGVICLTYTQDHQTLSEEVRRMPWVSCSEYLPDGVVPYVSIDHRQAAIDTVCYLINRGHSRIALLVAQEDCVWAQQRRAGYEFALQRAGLPLDKGLIRVARGTDCDFGIEAAGTLLGLPEPPTAVFAVSDSLAIGAIKAFRRAGLRVPEDIAVIGFDNIPFAHIFEPGLTTVAQPMLELGAAAAELLLAQLAGSPGESRILQHALIVRETA